MLYLPRHLPLFATLTFVSFFNPILATPAAAQSCANGAVPCLQAIGYLPGASGLANRYSLASVVSADGNVVAGIALNSSGQQEPFRWVAGTMQGLGKISGTYGICANGSDCGTPRAMSASGSIVVGSGWVREPGQPDHTSRPFIWSGSTMQEISPPCSARSFYDSGEGTGVNADGTVIVGSFTCNGMNERAFRNSSGTTNLLSFLPTYNRSTATGVNADGSVIVGWNDIVGQFNSQRPVRWSNSSVADLGLLSGDPAGSATAISADALTIVGATGNKAMRWAAGRVGDLDGASGGNAVGVSGDGSVIVRGGGIWMGRTGSRGGFKELLVSYGVDTSQFISTMGVVAVSADGRTFVGWATHADGKTQGFIARIPLPPVTHDFDGSAKGDILWRDSSSGGIAMWLMNGPAIQQSLGLGSAPTSWSVVGQRDFNGDGKHDLLWRDTSGNIAMWLMNAGSIQTNANLGSVPSTWSVAGTGDFNGDGKGDILWRESTTGNIALWLLNGATIVQNISVGSVPISWSVAGVADFNFDGKVDILWRDTSGNIAMWLMNGGAIQQSLNIGTVPTSYSVAGTGDFDGDGKADILWRDTSGNIAMWLMNGGAIQTNASLGSAPPSWSIAQTGDYNGDGKSDIVFRESSSGAIALWLMNGTAIQQNAGLGTAPTSWVIQGAGAD